MIFSRTIFIFFLTIILFPDAILGQSKASYGKHISPYVAVGFASQFYTKRIEPPHISPKDTNKEDLSAVSYTIGGLRHHKSKNKSVGLVFHSFNNRYENSNMYHHFAADTNFWVLEKSKTRITEWYIGIPITWSILNKNKRSGFFLGLTCQPTIYIWSYVNRQKQNIFVTSYETYFARDCSPISMILACAVGYRLKMSKSQEILLTINNELQPFNRFNVLPNFYQHRHIVELGLMFSY